MTGVVPAKAERARQLADWAYGSVQAGLGGSALPPELQEALDFTVFSAGRFGLNSVSLWEARRYGAAVGCSGRALGLLGLGLGGWAMAGLGRSLGVAWFERLGARGIVRAGAWVDPWLRALCQNGWWRLG